MRGPAALVCLVAWCSFAGEPAERKASREPSTAALNAATRGGKYAVLLKWIEVPEDIEKYGEVHDWGWWNGNAWAGYQVPQGYWVYVYPHWFIFKQQVKQASEPRRRRATPR